MKKKIVLLLALCMMTALLGPSMADGAAGGFQIVPMTWDGAGLGKMAVPNGWVYTTDVHCCDDTTCLGAPIRISAIAMSEEEKAYVAFNASESYIQRVRSSSGILRHEDGKLDQQTMIFMLQYLNATQYCDVMASTVNGTFYRAEDMSFYDNNLASHRNYFSNIILPGMASFGLNVNWLEVTAAQRVYTFMNNGETWALCILAETRGYQYTLPGVGDVCTLWDVPGYYSLVCPLASYQRLHDTVFTAWVENTAVSDTFTNLQDQITEQIAAETIAHWNMQVAASNAYASAMNALTSASVNSYLASSSYSSVDRFSDYIFDQNTYSYDGYEASISTSYDYVWAGDNGNFYYSNSALDVPYGASVLSPIR